MSRSSARRAQVEPLPALVAVAVLCLAVGAYASVRAGVAPVGGSGPPADAVLSETVDAATDSGSVVVTPRALRVVAPPGYEATVTVTVGDQSWTAGASDPPPDAATASRRVPVRITPGEVNPGRLDVEVWS
ncbi:hypothetical protein HALDL1_05535 [Halobacterium sp. DL1]|jgi:hypothetical protein|nr:hypothetical protein HALDL1_05535 [Halobacterium sp. DL1]